MKNWSVETVLKFVATKQSKFHKKLCLINWGSKQSKMLHLAGHENQKKIARNKYVKAGPIYPGLLNLPISGVIWKSNQILKEIK